MVSTRDIGLAAAKAFENPDQYIGKEVRLAGDQFTMPELENIYKRVRFISPLPESCGSSSALQEPGFGIVHVPADGNFLHIGHG